MEFIETLEGLVLEHSAHISLDHLRAYHFGSKYNVEVEVLLPPEMTVQQSHDIGKTTTQTFTD